MFKFCFVKGRKYVKLLKECYLSLSVCKSQTTPQMRQNVPCRCDCMFSFKLCAMYCRHAPTNAFLNVVDSILRKCIYFH